MNTRSPYALSRDPAIAALQRRWLVDTDLRRRVPPAESWRGCTGLALLLTRPDDTEYHGRRALLPNDHLTWMALRDVPPGHFPGSGPMHRRGVSYANAAQATLRYGMPVIDLSQPDRDAIDFRFYPGRTTKQSNESSLRPSPWTGDVLDAEARPRELEVLVRLSEAMTRAAFCGVDRRGRSVRPAWRCKRPLGWERPFQPAPPDRWVPVPYLAFPNHVATGLIERLSRQPSGALRTALCDAAAQGLPLLAGTERTYVGRSTVSNGMGHRYRFRETATGKIRDVHLPGSATVSVRPGMTLDAGQAWGRLLLQPVRLPHAVSPSVKWQKWIAATSDDVSGLVRAWIEVTGVATVASAPGLSLLPAAWVAPFVRNVPHGLWWDIAPAGLHLDGVLEAAVFPPVIIDAWRASHIPISGAVTLDVRIGDPRFDRTMDSNTARKQSPRAKPAVTVSAARTAA